MRKGCTERGASGFALVVVVFLLFAIGVASATGYTVVSLEADMSVQGEEATEARTIARAGLERYFGEHIGIPTDTTVYAIGNGTVYVSARRVAPADAADGVWSYVVTATAEVSNLSSAEAPARATVRQSARLHEEPIARTGALLASYANLDFDGNVDVSGLDAGGGTCPGSSENIHGVAHRGSLVTSGPANVVGAPTPGVDLGSHSAVFDTAGIRWDVLTDPTFPVDHVNSIPGWGFAAEDYPVIRWEGNLNAGPWHSGQGVLIVTGELAVNFLFIWEGVILAGELDSSSSGFDWLQVRGMVVGGLNGGGPNLTYDNSIRGPDVRYDRCAALAGSNALAYWEPLQNTLEEIR